MSSTNAGSLARTAPSTLTGDDNDWQQLRRPLYSGYFGLKECPFDLTPNPRFLFLNARQREALSNLRYGLSSHKGFTLLVGEAGTGKTTLLRTALGELGDSLHRYSFLNNPTLTRREFYEVLAREFGLSAEARTSKTRFLADLQVEVEGRFSGGGITGLIVDEAQSLPDQLLEEIRLLGNIETPTTKLLNIVLSGQPELAERLNQPSLRQLKQRVALRCEVGALSLEETAAYISGRIRISGGSPQDVFTRQAVIAIHEASAGIPRVINVLCDNALIGGYAARVKPITLEIVREVCLDFALESPGNNGTATSGFRPEVGVPRAAVAAAESTQKPAAATRVERERPMFTAINTRPKRRFIFFALLCCLGLAAAHATSTGVARPPADVAILDAGAAGSGQTV